MTLNISGKTLARGLRERSTICGEISMAQSRALTNAVAVEGRNQDFNVVEQIKLYREKQADLRALKTRCSEISITTLVEIPASAPIEEAGKNVPLYQAVLIRDDLKGQKSFFEQLTRINADNEERVVGDTLVTRTKTRSFDFEKTIEIIDLIQESIDAIDSLIQAKDNAVRL